MMNKMDKLIVETLVSIGNAFLEAECKNSTPTGEELMQQWWMNKKYWIKTLSGECCSTTELMAMKEEDGSWIYALVQTAHGVVSLKAIFKNGAEVL